MITIDKAIELLQCASQGFPLVDQEKYYQAMELGIEALKLIKRERILNINPVETLLPGETKG